MPLLDFHFIPLLLKHPMLFIFLLTLILENVTPDLLSLPQSLHQLVSVAILEPPENKFVLSAIRFLIDGNHG